MQKRVTRILDAKYEKADLKQLCRQQSHLSAHEQELLHDLLKTYEHLFDGTLGEWKGTGVSFELKHDATPFHAKPYPIAHVHEKPMRTECDRLVKLGVLEECQESEWAAPTFIIPKKNNTVRFISDFRRLNAALKRKPYPIPKIQDMLQKLEGFKYATALDLNMGYYTIKLNPDAQNLCTIVLPWGKYKYSVDTEIQPWRRLCVDCIGPYKIKRRNKPPLEFQAVTMIDPATSWFEMRRLKTKKADEVANMVEQTWLTRYPLPEEITFDGGPEFKAEFKKLIEEEYNLKARPSSVRNPQSNAIIERVHGTIGNMMRTIDMTSVNEEDEDPFAGIVSAVCWAVRSTYHTTLKATPGQLVFGRDMIFNIQYEADWQLIRERKLARMRDNNARENSRRIEHDYAVGDLVSLVKADFSKAEPDREGPYKITRVHTNGTVTVQKDRVEKRLNIHQCSPWHAESD